MRFVLGMTGRIPGAKLGASVYQLPSQIFPRDAVWQCDGPRSGIFRRRVVEPSQIERLKGSGDRIDDPAGKESPHHDLAEPGKLLVQVERLVGKLPGGSHVAKPACDRGSDRLHDGIDPD